jgi:protein SCO1/2
MSGLWSEGETASSGIGSERSQVASVAKRKPPASPGPRSGRYPGTPGPKETGRGRRLLVVAAVAFLVSAWGVFLPRSSWAHAVHDPQDDILRSIGVDEKLGGSVPRDAVFRNAKGEEVRLGDYLRGGPALLTLNYYTCPMLCPLTLHSLLGTVERMKGIDLGRDFRIVTVSFDPEDTPGIAGALAAKIYADMKGKGDPGVRWPFLVGNPRSIGVLTGAVGFRYRKVGREYAHPDVVVVLTPDGKISRYLYGVEQDPADLKLALLEASGGNIGESTALNRVLLFCFHYDPVGKKYALYAQNIMKAGGILTVALLGVLFLVLRRRGRGRSTS